MVSLPLFCFRFLSFWQRSVLSTTLSSQKEKPPKRNGPWFLCLYFALDFYILAEVGAFDDAFFTKRKAPQKKRSMVSLPLFCFRFLSFWQRSVLSTTLSSQKEKPPKRNGPWFLCLYFALDFYILAEVGAFDDAFFTKRKAPQKKRSMVSLPLFWFKFLLFG